MVYFFRKVYRSCLEISMLVAFLCIGHVLNDELTLPELPEKTVGDGHFFCRLQAIYDIPRLWPNDVPYIIITAGYSKEDVQILKAAIASWNEQVPWIQFVERQLNDTDFVSFEIGPVCSSFVGRRGGTQIITLDTDCLTNETIHHEMMHAIGFSHEHSRRDRNEYVEVLWNNIPDDWESEFEKIDLIVPNLLGPYDYTSNMHYLNFAPANEDYPAFKVLKKDVDEKSLDEDRDLTELDKQKIKRLYGRKSN